MGTGIVEADVLEHERIGFTSNVLGKNGKEDTSFLAVIAKTVNKMAGTCGLSLVQRQKLTELLSKVSGAIIAVPYGIGTGSDEIITAASSQASNEGGQPYWRVWTIETGSCGRIRAIRLI